jgi:hypothetical protein
MLKNSKTSFVLYVDDESHQIISPFEDKKVLVPAVCAECGAKGMTYADPKARDTPHYCHKHLGGSSS